MPRSVKPVPSTLLLTRLNCHFLQLDDTASEFFLKLISKSDANSYVHRVGHREVLFNPKMS